MDAGCGFLKKAAGLALALGMSLPAYAQVNRSSVDMAATPGIPEFRDPKTGQIWTPENVGQASGPNTPADQAFDPLAQAAVVEGVVVQRARGTPIGSIPITAGPTVPLATIENATLRAVPGQRWQVVLYLNNNSARTITPMLDCRFTNGGRPVEQTRVLVSKVGAGVRVGLTIFGPKTSLFVDRANCKIESP